MSIREVAIESLLDEIWEKEGREASASELSDEKIQARIEWMIENSWEESCPC